MRDIPIIVTRAEPGAEETYQRLKTRNLNAIKSPVLELALNNSVPVTAAETLSGLIFTSANGVRTFAARSQSRSLPAWCVGPATAAAARRVGFEEIHESAGNALDLAAFIQDRAPPSEKTLLHVANSAAKGDLKRALEAAGYNVAFCPLYTMHPSETLSNNSNIALTSSATTIVLIHSAKGAEAFSRLAGLPEYRSIVAVTISEPAARALAPLSLADVFIADEPNEDGLFAALETALATLSA